MIHVIMKLPDTKDKKRLKEYREQVERTREKYLSNSVQLFDISACKENYKDINEKIKMTPERVAYILIVSSGLEPSPGWDVPLIKALKDKDRVLAACPKIMTKGEIIVSAGVKTPDLSQEPHYSLFGFNQSNSDLFNEEGYVSYLSDDCFLIRTETLKENSFDEKFEKYFGDYDLCERLREKGKLFYAPESVFYFENSKNLGNVDIDLYEKDGKKYLGLEEEESLKRRGRPPKKVTINE